MAVRTSLKPGRQGACNMPAEINRFVIDLAPKLFGGARGRNTHLQRFGARRAGGRTWRSAPTIRVMSL